jgi:hypothetical protein
MNTGEGQPGAHQGTVTVGIGMSPSQRSSRYPTPAKKITLNANV